MTLPGNASERVIEGLSANTEYLLSMYATSAMGNGPTSNTRVFTRKCISFFSIFYFLILLPKWRINVLLPTVQYNGVNTSLSVYYFCSFVSCVSLLGTALPSRI